jgi:DNA-binding response OmpR family regulator/8-oxo-dGTP pyrophosphatase MutT (NUDIX family)
LSARSILVVEDEENIRHTLRYNLVKEGYSVSEARTGPEALSEARRVRPDLILLDLMLPGLSGLEVCRILRQEMSTPILMLTAKGAELDKVVGLSLGADDYVTKPFSLSELMARITAILRRVELGRGPAEPDDVEELDGFSLDRGARIVRMHGEEVRLAPKEFDLLSHLLAHSGRVQSRERLIQAVWGTSYYGDRKTVDVHVRWIREKFEGFDSLPFRITTVFGVGYRLDRLERTPPGAAAGGDGSAQRTPPVSDPMPEVRAAGGVVWRPGPHGEREYAVVHRPRYDDWSLPKGKLEAGETLEAAALREVAEETGMQCRLGPHLRTLRYTDQKGRLKTADFYLMEAVGGEFTGGAEVDELRWLDAADALRLLTYERDRDLLAEVARDGPAPPA